MSRIRRSKSSRSLVAYMLADLSLSQYLTTFSSGMPWRSAHRIP